MFSVADTTFTENKSSYWAQSLVGYPLSGKAYCGLCGGQMVGESAKQHGHSYNYYRCNNYRREKCQLKGVQSKLLEKIVLNATINFLADKLNLNTMADLLEKQQNSDSPFLTTLRKQLEEINTKRENIMKVIESGQGFDALKERYEKLDIQKKDTENQIALEESRMIKVNKADVKEIISSISNYDIQNKEGKVNLITQFVDSVYVFPDGKITIFFCFKGYKHVKFEDLKDKFSREPVKGKFYIEQVYNESSYGITIKDSSFRFADSSRKRQKSIYHNATTQYYKFLTILSDSFKGIGPQDQIVDQTKKHPKIFAKPFLTEMATRNQ